VVRKIFAAILFSRLNVIRENKTAANIYCAKLEKVGIPTKKSFSGASVLAYTPSGIGSEILIYTVIMP
jgi:hypothetical protein